MEQLRKHPLEQDHDASTLTNGVNDEGSWSGIIASGALEPAMWDRFAPDARNSFYVADEHARRRKGNFISTEHILLGLLHDEGNPVARVLMRMGFTLEAFRGELDRQMSGVGNQPYQPIQLTGNALSAIGAAYQEAARDNRDTIKAEDLLLGLLRSQGLAGRVLAQMGVNTERTEQEIAAMRQADSLE